MKNKLLKDKVIYIIGTGGRKVNYLPDLIKEFTQDGARTYTMFSNMGRKLAELEKFNIEGNIVLEGYSKERQSIPKEDLVLVAPCTFNTLNKIANGIADSYPLTILANAIGNKRKVIIALSMNKNLWQHPTVERSIKKLQEWGCYLIYPEVLPDRYTMSPIDKVADSVYHSLVGPKYEHEQMIPNEKFNKIIERYYPLFKSIGKEIQERGLTRGSGGCFSQKIEEGILITANKAEVGNLKPDEISLVTSCKGGKYCWIGLRTPSSETPLFYELHRIDPKNKAIIHSHCLKITYSDKMKAHVTSDYIRYGDTTHSDKVLKKLKEGEGFAILKLHGQISTGKGLDECLEKLKTKLKEVEKEND